MTEWNEEIAAQAFALVRLHSSPLVWPLLDSLERMSDLDRAALNAIREQADRLEEMLTRAEAWQEGL